MEEGGRPAQAPVNATIAAEYFLMPVGVSTCTRVALEDPTGGWELVCGRLRSKPGRTAEHNDVIYELDAELRVQLSRDAYRIRTNSRLQTGTGSYFVPGLFVLPRDRERRHGAGPVCSMVHRSDAARGGGLVTLNR